MLAMLQLSVAEPGVEVELTTNDRAELMTRHSLLLDPRDTPATIAPRWRAELQANVRQTLEKYLADRQLNQVGTPGA